MSVELGERESTHSSSFFQRLLMAKTSSKTAQVQYRPVGIVGLQEGHLGATLARRPENRRSLGD